MAKFDLETFRDTLKAFLVDNMAAKVSEINTEKGDNPVLAEIPEAQYFQDFNEKIVNFDNFIYYGFLPFEDGITNAGEIGQPVSMFFMTFITDQSTINGGIIAENTILRYTRAMFEIFQAESLTEASLSDLEITILPPESVKIEAGADWYKVGGVYVKGYLVL